MRNPRSGSKLGEERIDLPPRLGAIVAGVASFGFGLDEKGIYGFEKWRIAFVEAISKPEVTDEDLSVLGRLFSDNQHRMDEYIRLKKPEAEDLVHARLTLNRATRVSVCISQEMEKRRNGPASVEVRDALAQVARAFEEAEQRILVSAGIVSGGKH
ncbi:hypothetical protein M0P48_02300 [Candidatus Gracilibacteria bacterium]|jgi:hypothetical protein|nr:hypothetical protein [Candidatus Gracilibacteria bacterium]